MLMAKLMDLFASYLWLLDGNVEPFTVLRLTKKDDSADVVIDDGNGKKLYTQHIEYTDFPLLLLVIVGFAFANPTYVKVANSVGWRLHSNPNVHHAPQRTLKHKPTHFYNSTDFNNSSKALPSTSK